MSRHDRVVEVAGVRVDAFGWELDECCSLINPGRDLGPQRIRGIPAAQARQAPAFGDLAGEIAARQAAPWSRTNLAPTRRFRPPSSGASD